MKDIQNEGFCLSANGPSEHLKTFFGLRVYSACFCFLLGRSPWQCRRPLARLCQPSSASAPVGWQLAWQVLYPDSKDVGYWWDYDKQDIVTSLESASVRNVLLRFEYPWSDGRSVTYEADMVLMVVRKDGADYARRLRARPRPISSFFQFG